MGKHFAFVSMPTYGNVYPALPLVGELVRRGHRVSYATADFLHDEVRAVGAEPVSVQLDLFAASPGAAMDSAAIAARVEAMLDAMRRAFFLLCGHFGRHRVDAVCGDVILPTSRMVAAKLGVPFVSLNPSYASNEHFSLRGLLAKDAPPGAEKFRGPFDRLSEQLQKFADEQGLTGSFRPLDSVTAPLNLVFIPREFQFAAETFDDRFVFLGPSVGPRADTGTWGPPEEPVLYIALGTVLNQNPEFYRLCLEAFTGSNWRVAMAIGPRTDIGELGTIPPNFELRERFPQLDVLRTAGAFVSQVGMNSTMEALYFGVPLIAVPQTPEQNANAQRVEELGFGRRLAPGSVTADLLRKTVTQLVEDPAVRRNLDRISTTLRANAGAAIGADALEAQAR